jgi:hypothetical protein
VSAGRGLGDMAVQVACAFAEAFFAIRGGDGGVRVPLAQAHVFAAGRVDLWDGWHSQPPEVKRLVGMFLRLRHNELAAQNRFLAAARRQFTAADAPYALPAGVPSYEAIVVVPMHGQDPLGFAAQVLDDMKEIQEGKRVLLETAAPGTWSFGWQGRSTVELPVQPAGRSSPPRLPVVDTAPPLGEVKVSRQELEDLARELDRAAGQSWRHGIIRQLLAGLRDGEDLPVGELAARAGTLHLLNAPTGVGKSVLNRLLAIHLARAGIRVCLVVTNINEALNSSADIQADLRAVASQAGQRTPSCAPLVSVHRMYDKTIAAAAAGDWDRADVLGYGCALKAHVADGPLPEPGREPCTDLRPVPPPGSKAPPGGRAACPWRNDCGRHRLMREAVQADIIVTYHHMLASGHVPVPVCLDGAEAEGVSALELVMRACPVILIDEIDQFQSTLVDAGTKDVVLAAKGRERETLPLEQIESQRGPLPPEADRRVLPPLMRTRFLAGQFLNYVLDDEIWLDDPDGGFGSGWHLPGTRDDSLARALFAVPEGSEISADTYRSYDALFPDHDQPAPVALPPDLAGVRDLIGEAVSNDSGDDAISEVKHRLHEQLTGRLPDRDARNQVVNWLVVRAWLGALRQALTRLTFAVTSPEVQLPAARELAEKLGVFVQHAAIPYGPLGYLLFGFRVTRGDDPEPHGELSVEAIAGDPHTTTAQLPGVVALAAAGCERVVVGLSATAFFPGAAREHLHVPVTWAMTDAAPGGVTAASGQVLGDGMRPIHIAGLAEGVGKDLKVEELGRRLWNDRLGPHLDAAQADDRRDRARALVVGNSYRHGALLARGIGEVADPRRLVVAVSTASGRAALPLPSGAETLTADQFETFGHGPVGRVLLAPLSRVARGLNILVPGQQVSAISSIWVCMRPVAQVHEPAELFASVNSGAVDASRPSADPATALDAQRKAAVSRLHWILRSDRRFSLLPRTLKVEVVAGMLVDFIQLAGRARRGGTPVELFLVDGAFHDARLASDLPSLMRYHFQSLAPEERAAMRRIYGGMLTALLDFADLPAEEHDQ